MRELNLALALLGGITLALSLGAGVLRSRSYLPSETIVAVVFGVAIGPLGLDVFRLSAWGQPLVLIEEIARLTVALAVTSIALRLPADYFRRRAASMAVLLGPGLAIMWLASGLVADWLLAVPFWVAMLVGAVVAPTDPVLASTIVVGRTAEGNIPTRLRYLLSGEAGANDGGAYLFVFLAIFVLGHTDDSGLLEWATTTLLWEVLGAIVLGFAIGGLVGRLERWLSARGHLEETSAFTVTVALTFAVLGLVKLLGTDGILAVFVAGIAYNWQADPRDEAQEQKVEEVFNRLFTLPIFVLFGVALPWAEWVALGWRGVAFVVGILFLRRLPMVLALRPAIPPLDRSAATLFVGWFGPIGVAALFYATLAVRETGRETPWVLASLVVAGSILAHGATATVLTFRYSRLGDDAEWW
jgi:NhaP-type Na+/H+ or K+/H+ antiporter